MKYIAFFCYLIFTVNTNAQFNTDRTLDSLFKMEQALMDAVAIGDTMLWNKHVHDSCLITVEDGKTITKHTMIKELKPLPTGYTGRINLIQRNGRIYGNTAVLTFIDDEYLSLFNQNIHTQYKQTNTWMRFDSGWKMIAMQLFEIPKNPSPVILRASVLNKYTGTYALSSERQCTVYIKNKKLFAQKTNREPQELYAETENMFFREGDGRVNIIFSKSNDGKYQMIERREGEDLVWKKVSSKK